MSGIVCQPICPPARCENPFDRVVVSYLIKQGTVLFWELRRDFLDPRPLTFQLQVSSANNPNADDWEPVGAPIVDQYTATDGEQRVFGKIRWLFYRVKLTTSVGTYYSDPVGLEGTLGRRDWRIARETLRQELVRMKYGAGQEGYLLKRRVTGTRCPHCLDHQTAEVTQPYCEFCHGTGFLCGYFFPIGCVWADIDPKAYHLNIDSTRGTTADMVVKARMANIWLLSEEDIWVNKSDDSRYYVHSVQNIAEHRGVPLVASVELRPLPFTDPGYDIEIPDQLETQSVLRSYG